jgi:hypothetical protein
MHLDPIGAFQLAQQRHRDDLRSAEHRRAARAAVARSADRPRRTWRTGFTSRARTAGRARLTAPKGGRAATYSSGDRCFSSVLRRPYG